MEKALREAGLSESISPEGLSSLVRFSHRMLQINQNLNLTKWTKDEDFLKFHVVDSAHALPFLQPLVSQPQRWMDLGTGCGFPGGILAAAFPQMEITLMDSVAKKTKALGECIQVAGWKAQTLTGRAEELGQKASYRENWDGITTRAVADLSVVLEYALPLLKTGGYLVNWMTADQWKTVDKVQNALKTLRGRIFKRADYSLPGLELPRTIVIVEKLGKTPSIYPRPVGQASKNPL